ncbi:MAG: sigma-70 family RNA polymerase sigma factor [Planctomycetota bacterium]|jgi:RNA polymerase sigma factor (sigma-70 family)|nr:sigma-70 family RNA polymerase sigma factor [Planctomycetota bacterium]MDP6955909.1 sigma-70 family RNA polymerase sigma factor [Planctomycetota bacterium]
MRRRFCRVTITMNYEGNSLRQTVISHGDLDDRIRVLVEKTSDAGDVSLADLAREIGAAGAQLEVRGHWQWRDEERKQRPSTTASVEEQLRQEVDRIRPLSREEEQGLARRMEVARLLLAQALDSENLTHEDLEAAWCFVPERGWEQSCEECSVPPLVCRRWKELHALRTEMVERNLYLILLNVDRYARNAAQRLDLIQEGSIALFRAADGFEWRRGLLFRTYAVHWLNQAFRSFLYNFGRTIRVPVYLQKASKHVQRAAEKLGPDPSVDAIAECTGLTENVVESTLKAQRPTYSLDRALIDGEEGHDLANAIGYEAEDGPYDTSLEDTSLEDGLRGALGRLNERERFVLAMRFGLERERDHTLAEVAREIGVSLERVRQIQMRAIAKLDTPSLRRAVAPFLS